MEWRDDGLILGTRKHGETSVIVEAMTRAHGRHFGLVRGGRSKRMQPLLQPGNHADLVWRARLDEHLGTFSVEPIALRTARLMTSAEALHAVCHVAALLRLAAERDPHPALYETAVRIAGGIDRPESLAPLIVRFEAEILSQMGFGLDLETCAATGATQDLVYVSPKSGRAVSKAAGEPYKARLLPLPSFLRDGIAVEDPPPAAIRDGFKLTGFFLARDLFGPRGQALPEARGAYLAALGMRFRAVA
ncbi:MAG TPA: DNA repair protein RecO [Methylocella sp.]|nr:DNA repair protein RecO [Methylocella sp.]